MKERPILFSAPMLRALLDGSKTQTRRIVKGAALEWLAPDMFTPEYVADPANHLCPYGAPGDLLWVRETFGFNPDHPGMLAHCCYRADPGHEHDGITWKPSIHMPRAASRILLEVVSVRVERLNECSAEDAKAEGIRRIKDGFERWHPCPTDVDHEGLTRDPVLSYRGLWESINGDGSWAANPWVWVVEFKRVNP